MIPISDIIIRSLSGFTYIIPILIVYFLFTKKTGRNESVLHVLGVFIFVYYLCGVLTVTGIGYTKTITFNPRISWIPFIGMITGPVDTILNIILFVPLGFFLPLLYKKYKKLSLVVLTGFIFSVSVEAVQMFDWGSSDVNDLITNTFGTFIGFEIYSLLSRILTKRFKEKLLSKGTKDIGKVIIMIVITYIIMLTLQPWFVHGVIGIN